MDLLDKIKDIWPIRFLFEKKTAELILDNTTFTNGESKVVTVWRWKLMKRVKFLVHYRKEDGKFVIRQLK